MTHARCAHSRGPRLEKHDAEVTGTTRREQITVLDPRALARWCERSHLTPSPDLAPFIEVVWTMRWDLRDREPFEQRVLPNPCVQLVVDSRGGARVLGVVTGAYSHTLEGEAFVLGVKFRPGGFQPFFRRAVAELTDGEAPLGTVLPGIDTAELARLAERHDGTALLLEIERALRALGACADARLDLVAAVMERITSDPEIQRVEDAARAFGVSVRALQRLFRSHVGVSPKWVIRRVRLKEAAARIESGAVESWAQLAIALGYFDQAHLVNDFTSMIGQPPSGYARSLTPR